MEKLHHNRQPSLSFSPIPLATNVHVNLSMIKEKMYSHVVVIRNLHLELK